MTGNGNTSADTGAPAGTTATDNTGSSTNEAQVARQPATDHLKFHSYHEVFEKLKISGANYLTWRRDIRQYANVRKLAHTLPSDGQSATNATGTPQEKAYMLAIMRAHMDEGLKDFFDDEDQPAQVWVKLDYKYALTLTAQKARVRQEWHDLGVDRCSSLDEYETKLNGLAKKMRLCGHREDVTELELIRKTVETLGDGRSSQRALSHGHRGPR